MHAPTLVSSLLSFALAATASTWPELAARDNHADKMMMAVEDNSLEKRVEGGVCYPPEFS